MTRGDIFRMRERVAERGDKPGFYVGLMFKSKLTHYVGSLGPERATELGRALSIALEIEASPTHTPLPLRRR